MVELSPSKPPVPPSSGQSRVVRYVDDPDPLLRRYEWTCETCGMSHGLHEVRCPVCDPYPFPAGTWACQLRLF